LLTTVSWLRRDGEISVKTKGVLSPSVGRCVLLAPMYALSAAAVAATGCDGLSGRIELNESFSLDGAT